MAKKISIVVPIYNNEEHLKDCLNSLISQTLQDIEIICVDDGSDDGSIQILKAMEQTAAGKIKCLYHSENQSASQCRKDGVLASVGEYIMFADADDFFEKNACEIAYQTITKRKHDIVQFGTIIENCANLPAARIDLNKRLVAPFVDGPLRGDLLSYCFLEKKISVNVWNKIVKGNVCRSAFAEIQDGYFPKANDLYALFFILKHANSFSGLAKPLYHYRFGLGMTGKPIMNIENFSLHCQGVLVLKEIRKLVEAAGAQTDPNHLVICDKIEANFINEQLGRWHQNLPKDLKKDGLRIMNSVWERGFHFIVGHLANKYWFDRAEISKYFEDFEILSRIPRPTKTIALYYHRIVGGGAQRVVADTCNLFARATTDGDFTYKVVLVTDEDPSPKDFDLDPRVEHVVIPAANLFPKKARYIDRAQAWVDLIDNYDVDLVINSAWLTSANLWDLLAIKSHPRRPAFINHTHNFFALPFRIRNKVREMLSSYSIADGVITLSEMDREFWANFNPNSYLILNPTATFQEPDAQFLPDRKRILWLARISNEKRPLEIVRIMDYVARVHPDAVCNIVGDGDEKTIKELKKEISDRNLESHINLLGYSKDVSLHYSTASVFVMTSMYEGFGLTLTESASFGLPTVIYDLPWLEYFNIFEGWERVDQLNAKAAADKICELLSDEEKWLKASRSLKNSFQSYQDIDVLKCWEDILRDLETQDVPANKSSQFNKILIEQIVEFHQQGIQREITEKKQVEAKLKRTYKEKSELIAQVERMRFIPRVIRIYTSSVAGLRRAFLN